MNRAGPKQKLENVALSLLRLVSLPIRVLIKSPVTYSTFLILSLSGLCLFGIEINNLLLSFLEKMQEEQGIRPTTFERLLSLSAVLSVLVPFPFAFSSLIMPLRVFLLRQGLPLKDLFLEAPACYRLAVQSWITAARTLFILLLPLFALLFLFSFLELQGISLGFRLGLLALSLVLISPLLARAVPALCIPYISVLGRYEPLQASRLAWEIVQHGKITITFLHLLAVSASLLAFLYVPPVTLLGASKVGLLPLIISLVTCWLCLSAAGGVCASSMVAHEQRMIAARQARHTSSGHRYHPSEPEAQETEGPDTPL